MKKWFMKNVWPYIAITGMFVGVAALIILVFWLDRVRFVF